MDYNPSLAYILHNNLIKDINQFKNAIHIKIKRISIFIQKLIHANIDLLIMHPAQYPLKPE